MGGGAGRLCVDPPLPDLLDSKVVRNVQFGSCEMPDANSSGEIAVLHAGIVYP